jgi:hypothetical protein
MGKETRVGALVLAGLVIAGVAIFILGRQEHSGSARSTTSSLRAHERPADARR